MKTKDWSDCEIKDLFNLWWKFHAKDQTTLEAELTAFVAGFKLAAAMWNN